MSAFPPNYDDCCVDEDKWPAAAQRKLKELTSYADPPLSWTEIAKQMREFPWAGKSGEHKFRSESMCRAYFWKRQEKSDGWVRVDARKNNPGRPKTVTIETLQAEVKKRDEEIEELRALVAKMSAAEDETLDALEEQANALRRARSV